MKGYVHSTDSFGTVDGPGVRFVVFLQGCPLRCMYCHNPDTWKPQIGNQMTVEEILKKYNSCKEFLRNGGITVTGGEPLLQIDFVTELFSACKKQGIHTCLDTSGITYRENAREKFDKLMAVTDLIMLDIKHIDDEGHKKLTGMSNIPIKAFAQYLCEIKKDVWIRHVLVPEITLKDDLLEKLGYYIGGLKNVKALDVLPYHNMGNSKYEKLGLVPPLIDTPEATKEMAIYARGKIMEGIKKRLRDDIAK